MKFLLLGGSFHKKSFTQALLKVIAADLHEHHVTLWPLLDLPFYSVDLEGSHRPSAVVQFLDAVTASDGLIFCTPEYNHSIPAVLKNAIDWASRPAFQSPLKGKPVTIITQATTGVGGARAQAHLKLILDSTLSIIHLCHETMVSNVGQKFDSDLNLTDETTKRHLKRHIDDFIDVTSRHCAS